MPTTSLNLRVISLSATVSNIHDVSKCLQNRKQPKRNTRIMVYNNSYGAVFLKEMLFAYRPLTDSDPLIKDRYLRGKLTNSIKTYFKNKTVLTFCSTRSSISTTAKYIGGLRLKK